MKKLDSHQHFWDLSLFQYPWLTPDKSQIYRNFGPPDLEPELIRGGFEGSIAVQATHSQAETEWLLKLAGIYPFIKGVVGWTGLTAYNLDAQLEALASQGPLVGLRHQVHDEPDPEWLLQSKVVRGLRLVAEKKLVFDLLVRPPHLKFLPSLFEAVPGMVWVVDHIAKPEIKQGLTALWWQDLGKIAFYPNVYCKVSGMVTEADQENWKVEDLRPYFEKVLEIFGPSRLLFGSDWPVCLLAGSYYRVQELVTELLKPLSPGEQTEIWGGTARKVYKIK